MHIGCPNSNIGDQAILSDCYVGIFPSVDFTPTVEDRFFPDFDNAIRGCVRAGLICRALTNLDGAPPHGNWKVELDIVHPLPKTMVLPDLYSWIEQTPNTLDGRPITVFPAETNAAIFSSNCSSGDIQKNSLF